MLEKRAIRKSGLKKERQEGSERKVPHRRRTAHKVRHKWAYYRAVLIWIFAVGLLLLTLINIGYGVLLRDKVLVYKGLAFMGVWILMRIMFCLAAKATICPLCRAHHFGNTRSSKHRNAYKVFPFSYRSTAVLTVALMRCIRCMHCGVTFDLTKKP